MKLKKLLAGVTAAALTVGLVAVTPMISAESLSDVPNGNETVLYSADLSAVKTEFTTAWDDGDWTQINIGESDRDTIMTDSEVYVKATMSNVGAVEAEDGDVDFDSLMSWGWSGYNWITGLKWYNNADNGADFECNLIPIPTSTSDNAVAYAPISDFAMYDWGGIAGNLQCGHFNGLTVDKLEIVRIDADKTQYAEQEIEVPEGTDNCWPITGTFDTSKIQGPNARIEITWTVSGLSETWEAGIKLTDSTFEQTVAQANGTVKDGQQTTAFYFKNFDASEIQGIGGWGLTSIDRIVIYNDETMGNVYTEASKEPVEVTATVTPDSVTVNTETVAEQKADVEREVKVEIEGLEASDFTYDVELDTAATEDTDATATVRVTLSEEAAKEYVLTEDEYPVTVKFVNLDNAVYQGYTADTAVSVDAAEGDTDDNVKAAAKAAIEAKTITLKGVGTDNKSGKIGSVKSGDIDLGSVKAENGEYTVSVDVDVYKIIRQGKDLYFPEDVSTEESDKASDKITVTFTVTVTVPEKPEDPKPEDPTPVDPKPEDPTPVDPKPEDPTPVDPKPEDPTPVDPTPGTPETPAIVPTATNNRVGDGGSVPTDVNTGAAFTGTRAMEEVAKAKSGDSINVVMTNGMSEGEIIAKIAYKKDVTVNLKYSAYSVSINSDDVAEDFEAKGFYSTSRFLSADEKAAFAGAKELRQISVKNLNGIEKATVTVTMRGGSKGMDATALSRTSAGKYRTVETGKVAEDRTFSFEVTKAGNYVVYAGKVDMGE